MQRQRPTPDSFLGWWPVIVRFCGLGMAIFETAFEHADRPSLLVLAAGMMGLPSIVRWQDKLRNGSGNRDRE